MKEDIADRIWVPIIRYLSDSQQMHDSRASEAQCLAQFRATRYEILEHFRANLGAKGKDWNREKALRQVNAQTYFDDLRGVGIDPRGIFAELFPEIDFEIQDVDAWKNHQASGVITSTRPNVAREVSDLLKGGATT